MERISMENNKSIRLPSTMRDNDKKLCFVFIFLTNDVHNHFILATAIQIFAVYIQKDTTYVNYGVFLTKLTFSRSSQGIVMVLRWCDIK